MEKVAGILEVSHTEDTHEIVIVHPDLKPDSTVWAESSYRQGIRVIWQACFWSKQRRLKMRPAINRFGTPFCAKPETGVVCIIRDALIVRVIQAVY